MFRYSFLILLLLQFQFSISQTSHISEFDFYGCWIPDGGEEVNGSTVAIFRPCKEATRTYINVNPSLTFSSYDKCTFYVLNNSDLNEKMEGTWTYDSITSVLEIHWPKGYLESFGIDSITPYKRFQVVSLESNTLRVKSAED